MTGAVGAVVSRTMLSLIAVTLLAASRNSPYTVFTPSGPSRTQPVTSVAYRLQVTPLRSGVFPNRISMAPETAIFNVTIGLLVDSSPLLITNEPIGGMLTSALAVLLPASGSAWSAAVIEAVFVTVVPAVPASTVALSDSVAEPPAGISPTVQAPVPLS